jgi:uncharacterized membrane protein YoaK (UPF0700 family)
MNRPGYRTLLATKVLLLTGGAGLALHYGPFPTGDSVAAVATGMLLVAAMAIQNAAHRIYFAQLPPTTMMTDTTTQIMIDVADLLQGFCAGGSHAGQDKVAAHGCHRRHICGRMWRGGTALFHYW